VAVTDKPVLYLVMKVPGPNWDPERDRREQDGWDEHAAYMDGLASQGKVVLGGPAGDGDEALVLFDAPDEEAVLALLKDDPWTGNILDIASIVPWTIWVDGRAYAAREPGP
jgi:uncharacterized protein YciI